MSANHHPHPTLDRIARSLPMPTRVATDATLSIHQPEHAIWIDIVLWRIAPGTRKHEPARPPRNVRIQIWTDDGRIAHNPPEEDQPTTAEPEEVHRALNRAVAGWLDAAEQERRTA